MCTNPATLYGMRSFPALFKCVLDILIPPRERGFRSSSITVHTLRSRITQPVAANTPETLALFSYRDAIVRDGICALKYDNRQKLAGVFAEVLYPYLIEELADQAAFTDIGTPLLIPMPLARARLHKRGYNQAELIARKLFEHDKNTAFSYAPNLLYRVKNTPSQAHAENEEERRKNLCNAFSAKAKRLSGRTVILLDDVITTGSTMREARSTVYKAGAHRVVPVTLAASRTR